MKPQIEIRDFIRQVLSANRFAVLATVSEGKPHSSFVAYTASGDSLQLIFATYRHTRKYANLKQNNQVSMLIENSKDRRQHQLHLDSDDCRINRSDRWNDLCY